MNIKKLLMVTAVTLSFSAPVMAQTADTGTTATVPTAGSETQRDTNQQNRIEQGLQSGQLNTKEAAGLEKNEQHIDKVESRDMKNGTLSDAEKARIQTLQNKQSADIASQKHDAQTGNPDSASSQRMQADVQRDANQEQRIHNGVANGTVTNKEAGTLEKGQARNDRTQAAAGANGKISARGQARLQRKENATSKGVFRKKHNGRNRKAAAATTP